MKTLKTIGNGLFAMVLLLSVSCSSDDDTPTIPKVVIEEEIITTATITLTPEATGTPVTLQTRDADGDGPNPPVITVSGNLLSGTVYNGSIELLNETESPAGNVTEEVEEKANEHQFFYDFSEGLNATIETTDVDDNGYPVGIEFKLTTAAASTGRFTVTLRHEPKKPNTGISDAGGSTDIETTFDLTIE